jgi:uncharacterized small protein (DUF1192 family)
MITKSNALLSLCPGAEWTIHNDDLEWLDTKQTQPTEAEIQAEITRLQAEYDAQAYARSRAAEYPAIGDQLDALFHAGVFPAEMAAQIQAIKDKYPKG